jgi:hypothetical protein
MTRTQEVRPRSKLVALIWQGGVLGLQCGDVRHVKGTTITFSLVEYHNRSSSGLKLPKLVLILALEFFLLTSNKPKQLVVTRQISRQLIYLSNKIINRK